MLLGSSRGLAALPAIVMVVALGLALVVVDRINTLLTSQMAAAGAVDGSEPKTCEEAKQRALRGEQLNDGPARGSVSGTVAGKTELDKCISAFMTPMGFMKKQKGMKLSVGDYECKGRRAVTNVETGKVTDISLPERTLHEGECQRTVNSEKPKDESGKPMQPQAGNPSGEMPPFLQGKSGQEGGSGQQAQIANDNANQRVGEAFKELDDYKRAEGARIQEMSQKNPKEFGDRMLQYIAVDEYARNMRTMLEYEQSSMPTDELRSALQELSHLTQEGKILSPTELQQAWENAAHSWPLEEPQSRTPRHGPTFGENYPDSGFAHFRLSQNLEDARIQTPLQNVLTSINATIDLGRRLINGTNQMLFNLFTR